MQTIYIHISMQFRVISEPKIEAGVGFLERHKHSNQMRDPHRKNPKATHTVLRCFWVLTDPNRSTMFLWTVFIHSFSQVSLKSCHGSLWARSFQCCWLHWRHPEESPPRPEAVPKQDSACTSYPTRPIPYPQTRALPKTSMISILLTMRRSLFLPLTLLSSITSPCILQMTSHLRGHRLTSPQRVKQPELLIGSHGLMSGRLRSKLTTQDSQIYTRQTTSPLWQLALRDHPKGS